ncbi:cyclic nucleotide-binding domain-containing protein [Defluviitalea raffinosedens]|uniref:Cyclic nucleotide-binding domain-containing protein n=1 Tax=Defluviitalea raffinosedens TaxID=1450156 RepID=A0A7C8LEU4_9FIRM|nr:Crp/Fnr family transcriptional regulator [Defluviitalea raffinosedens]KAE9634479.1 cyclic nucleotide-binding domain-containing protein [Defluviitalea raffinosedens]HHW66956.1 Crp/Fnr family transcriptional regulator [Candidatus Epulonipiscium sp.]
MSKHICNCEHCQHKLCARNVPIFSSLNPEEIEKVVSLIVRRKYSKGEIIVLEGSSLESLVIINTGKVKAFRHTFEGKEQILYIFSSGDFFGEKNLIINQKVTYSVEALEDTNICMISKGDFKQLLNEYPEISYKIMEELCKRLIRMEDAVESMSIKSVEARISAVLLEFANKYGKPHSNGILVELPLSREGIANYIGLTRETVSRKMSLLQEEGIIKMVGNKKIIITDKEALENSINH